MDLQPQIRARCPAANHHLAQMEIVVLEVAQNGLGAKADAFDDRAINMRDPMRQTQAQDGPARFWVCVGGAVALEMIQHEQPLRTGFELRREPV